MQLAWETEIDTPATVAVVGGGPAGIEAALYARFLGYDVRVFDAAKVGDSLLRWGRFSMPGTWRTVTSSLGLAALEAQAGSEALPPLDAIPTYEEYVEKYLLPIARTDLLYDSISINAPVESVSRLGLRLGADVSIEQRADQEFRVLVKSAQRGEFSQVVDLVLDCSGASYRQVGLASGGGLAVGQRDLEECLLHGKRSILGRERSRFEGRHWLLFGNDVAACANAYEFQQLAMQASNTRLTWIIPKRFGVAGLNLDWRNAGDANLDTWRGDVETLLENNAAEIVVMAAWGLESVRQNGERLDVRLQSSEEETTDLSCDGVIHCSGSRLDWSACSELMCHQAIDDIVTAEPHYYTLGAKSGQGLDIPTIFDQVRRAFGYIGGRAELNLYETVRPQSSDRN